MKFRQKIYFLVFSSSSVLALILLLWFSLFTINETLTRERFILRDIAREIEKTLLNNEHETAHITEKINNGLRYVRGNENMGYRVLDEKGNNLCSYNYKGKAVFPELPENAKHNYIFEWHSWSLQNWRFDFFYFGKDVQIALHANRHIEMFENLWPFFFVTVILILVFSFVGSHIIAAILLKPIVNISFAAGEVANGNFSYRIPLTGANDEIEMLEVHLNKTFTSLEESFSKISEFSSEVAHELRTPLTVLRGNLEVAIRKERTIEEYQCVLTEAADELNRLQRLVNDMLMMLRPVTAYDQSSFQKVDLATVLMNVIEQLSLISESKDIKLESKVSSDIFVSGIESLLHRICFNLIHNAIRFSPNGATVNISLEVSKNQVILTVTDEGQGIKKEDMEKVFQRFYRNENSTGHGLGLPMAKQLVELHGGSLQLESEYSKGSVFTVILPNGNQKMA